MITTEQIYEWLNTVTDPEVPVLTILDLGIVRNVQIGEKNGGSSVVVTITPTYSGCPAMDVIAMQIRMVLLSKGIKHVNIENQLSPAWTTDWMTKAGKDKLTQYGIAPPYRKSTNPLGLFEDDNVPCPRCGSVDTILSAQFAATSCKSLYKCNSCHEPFEHFKCH